MEISKIIMSANEHKFTPILLASAALIIVIAGIKTAAPLITEFLISLFIAVVCLPSIQWMQSKRVPKTIAIIIVLAAILGFVYLVVALIGDSINDFNQNKDFYVSQLNNQYQTLNDWLIKLGVPVGNLEIKAMFEKLDIMSMVTTVLGGVGTLFGNFFIIFLTVIFLLAEAASFSEKFTRAFSDSTEKMVHVNAVLEKVRHYLAIKTIASLLTGVSISCLLWLIGVDYPFLWGFIAFLLNFIPNFGSLLAAVPAIILALVQLGPTAVLWTALSYFAVNNIIGNFIEPKLMGRMLGLSAFVVFISLIFWGYVLGTVGMFLSVPLTMTIKIILDANERTRWFGILLGPPIENGESEAGNV